MKNKIITIGMDGTEYIHIKRHISTIDPDDLLEYGKCAYCSLEHKKECNCTSNYLYELEDKQQ